MKNLLIVGAGEAGRMVARELQNDYNLYSRYKIVGYIDDNTDIKDVFGVKVIGKISDIKDLILINDVETVFITIPTASSNLIKRILDTINGSNVEIKIIPGIMEIIEGNASYRQLRKIEPEDLLGREEVSFDIELISSFYSNKTIFVTGAGGSIGSEIFIQLLKLPVKKIVAYGHGENSIHNLIQIAGNDKRFEYSIGDIRDYQKLYKEIDRIQPDIVFHAAAHKHLPLMEERPDEAIKNNVFGTFNTAKAALLNNVPRFVFVSTDKAVNPTSIMGATKRIAEKIVLSMNGHGKTIFSLTRFGNVLGSRGSVIPIFKKQIESGGPITITHEDMTRYFMSIREAARLVIKSATLQKGHIFILDMGKPVKIADLAKTMVRLYGYTDQEIAIQFTGIRPGEKLFEEVLTKGEEVSKTSFEKLFISSEKEVFFLYDEIETFVNKLLNASETYEKESLKKLILEQV